jgi:hypothetical protein
VVRDAVPQPDNVILQNRALRKVFSLERGIKKVTECATTKFVIIAKVYKGDEV